MVLAIMQCFLHTWDGIDSQTAMQRKAPASVAEKRHILVLLIKFWRLPGEEGVKLHRLLGDSSHP